MTAARLDSIVSGLADLYVASSVLLAFMLLARCRPRSCADEGSWLRSDSKGYSGAWCRKGFAHRGYWSAVESLIPSRSVFFGPRSRFPYGSSPVHRPIG